MSFLDKAKQFLGDNPDKVRQGIEKVGDEIDKRTGGKYAEQIDRVQEEAAKRLGGDADGPGTKDAPSEEPEGGRP